MNASKVVRVPLGQLADNPFRGLDTSPYQEPKLAALTESVDALGLWEYRWKGRRLADGTIQIAFHHHLREAAKKLLGTKHEVQIELSDLTDSEMFQLLARENMAGRDQEPLENLHLVRTLLEAIKGGVIKLPAAKQGPRNDFLQKFGTNLTGEALTRFLGWMSGAKGNNRIYWILEALELIEHKQLKEKDLAGLNEHQAAELVRELKRRREYAEHEALQAEARALQAEQALAAATSAAEKKEAARWKEHEVERAREVREEAKNAVRLIATEIGTGLREGTIATRQIREKTSEFAPRHSEKKLPHIESFATELAAEFRRVLGPGDVRREKLQQIADYSAQLSGYSREILVGALEELTQRINYWIERFDPKKTNGSARTPVKTAGPRKLT